MNPESLFGRGAGYFGLQAIQSAESGRVLEAQVRFVSVWSILANSNEIVRYGALNRFSVWGTKLALLRDVLRIAAKCSDRSSVSEDEAV